MREENYGSPYLEKLEGGSTICNLNAERIVVAASLQKSVRSLKLRIENLQSAIVEGIFAKQSCETITVKIDLRMYVLRYHVTTRLHENNNVVGEGIILGLTIHYILYCWRIRNPFLLIIAKILEPGRELMGEFSLSWTYMQPYVH